MRRAAVIACGLLAACAQGHAAEPADVDAGRRAAAGCSGCHDAHTVDLSGRDADDLVEVMQDMRDGRNQEHPPVLGLLSDRQVIDIAAFFSAGTGK